MICIAGNMPTLQVGNHQVSDYETHWIRKAIQDAAVAAEQPDFLFTNDVYDGVVYYLENKCPLKLLPLESLFDRIRHTLIKIGFSAIADALKVESPAVTISLETAATEAGNGYELAFYGILSEQMANLKRLGAEEVFFSHMRESILILQQTETWSPTCDQLERDILLWFRKAGTKPQHQGYRIRCNLQKIKVQ